MLLFLWDWSEGRAYYSSNGGPTSVSVGCGRCCLKGGKSGSGECPPICVISRQYDAQKVVPSVPQSPSGGCRTSQAEKAPKLTVFSAFETSPWRYGDVSPGVFCDMQEPWWPHSLDP